MISRDSIKVLQVVIFNIIGKKRKCRFGQLQLVTWRSRRNIGTKNFFLFKPKIISCAILAVQLELFP